MWQFIAGGGEDDETPEMAARREANEEAGIIEESGWIRLDSVASIPRSAFGAAHWPKSSYVIPEYCFAVEMKKSELTISQEHDGWGDVLRLTDPAQWCLRNDHFVEIAFDNSRGMNSFGLNHAGVDRIDTNFPRAEFLGE